MPPSPTEAEVGGATETRPQWDMAGLTWPNLHGIERFSGPRAFSDKTGTVLAKPGGLASLQRSLGFSFFFSFSLSSSLSPSLPSFFPPFCFLALLQYNSHTIQFNHREGTINGFCHIHSCVSITCQFKVFTEVLLIYNVNFYFTANDSDIHARSFSYSFPLWFITGY